MSQNVMKQLLLIMHLEIEREKNMPPPNTPLCHKDYFKLVILEIETLKTQ